jgi:SpoVK/Ycf46/Vps4 family AAA+-type ATPase
MATLHPIARDVAVLSRSGYPLVYIVTQEEDRALRLVEAAALAAKRPVVRWSASLGFAGAEEIEHDPGAAIESLASITDPSFFVMLDLHPYLNTPAVVRRLRDRLNEAVTRRQTIVIIAPVLTLPPDLEKESAVIDLPLPKQNELDEELIKVARLERIDIDPEVADRAVRSALGLSLNEASRVFRKVLVLKKGLTEADLKLIVEEKKNVLRKTDVLEFHELGTSLSDVGGLGEMKRWLAARTEAFGDDARDFGLPPPKGLLLLGVQGCGKSLSAKAVAELWKFPLLRLDVGAMFSGTGGASPEASMREAIKVSESLAPVVLWIDEIEKGFAQTDGDESSSRVFGSFITWLSEKKAEVFVVATANDVSGLPPELLRRGRFDEIFFIDLPNQHERMEILRVHVKKRGRQPERYPILQKLAKESEHFSGAELEQVVVGALYNAFAEKREMLDQDLALSMKTTVPLYMTYEEKIKALRDWAKTRARPATLDSTVLDLFGT